MYILPTNLCFAYSISVNFKPKGMNVTINCAVPKFDGSKSAHTATAVVTGR